MTRRPGIFVRTMRREVATPKIVFSGTAIATTMKVR